VPTLVKGKVELLETDIHLWITRPQHIQDSELLAQYRALLTAEEKLKQQRYRFEKDRHTALITRAFIRDLLSSYAAIAPADWSLKIGANGKPEIFDPPIPLRFNLSHTKNLIICAVTLHNEIGCDVESVGRSSDILAIANHYFSASETKELFSLPEREQRSRFFDYWTLKESYIKARGVGLFAIPLEDFSFHIGRSPSTTMNDNICLSFASHIDDKPEQWRSWIFYPSKEHRMAVSTNRVFQDDGSVKCSARYKIRFFESIPLIHKKELICQTG
jgi:4'-phosphopantetheinyl transferase